MAYNSNTRLLLQFETPPDYNTDTSQAARACSISSNAWIETVIDPYGVSSPVLFCDGLNSSGRIGQISVDSPGTLFASTSSVKRVDLRYNAASEQDAGSQGLLDIVLSTGQNLRLYTDSDGTLTFISTGGAPGTLVKASAASAANNYGTGWHEVRMVLDGVNIYVGRDGAEVINSTHTAEIWGSGTVVSAAFGQGQSYWSFLGHLDSIQVFEGETSWMGGAYTVPPAKPGNYEQNPTLLLTGQALAYSCGSMQAAHPVTVGLSGQVVAYAQGAFLKRYDYVTGPKTLFGAHYGGRLVGDDLIPKAGREEAAQIAQEFWQAPVFGPAPVSVGLAGQDITYSQGALSPSVAGPVAVALHGQSLAYAQGGVGRGMAIGVAGATVAHAVGAVARNSAVALSGAAVTLTPGAVSGSRARALDGQSLTYAQGSAGFSFAPEYDPRTLLLVKFNEANGATTVYDKTPAGRAGACLSVAAVTNTQGVFGSHGVAVGNPGGTKDAYAFVEFSDYVGDDIHGLFLDSGPAVPKQFDLWFRPSTNNSHTLFSLELNNGDSLWLRSNSTTIEAQYLLGNGTQRAYCSGAKSTNLNTWRHYRLLLDGPTLRVGYNGSEVCSTTIGANIWTGDPSWLPYAWDVSTIRIGRPKPAWDSSDYDFLAAQGYFDDFSITSGAVSWSGGAYGVPAYSPADAPNYPARTGVGANTLEALSSAGVATLIDPRSGAGANTVEDCLGTGAAIHMERYAAGANAVEDTVGEGVVAVGASTVLVGASTVEPVTSTSTAVLRPISIGTGGATAAEVTSVGEGGIGWRVGDGASTLEALTSAGAGAVAAYSGPVGVGSSTTLTYSSGAGTVSVSGAGQSTTAVTSAGTVKDEQFADGAATVSVTSAGVAQCETRLSGANTTHAVTSTGGLVVAVFGTGQSVASVGSHGAGVLPVFGAGSTLVSVMTAPEFLGDDVINQVCFQRARPVFVRRDVPSITVRAA